ncbi:MAG: M28 family peptidase [Verrucomicrobia bacterium]|nr:M28 family peptidase [Verrucomicrobiota bacterium]MBU4291748.1 M28 family peptidase [Verrucomicrobiota bacterium]MBU4429054.1 M28 family peptidase [Verrucomicrobiota bacterium]MCG2679338.1 M28 family metallopeptidase [Kiritimatiellia bacterium]
MTDVIPSLIARVDQERLKRSLFYLAKDPLPFRKLNYTIPGHAKNTLYEADDYIQSQLEFSGYAVDKEGVKVQAFRCDSTKPKSDQYSSPAADDPWYTAYNIYARRPGREMSGEVILLLGHKDSQSWVDSPGAYDNAGGTVALLEIARVLSKYRNRRSLWFLFCNEEHCPWTSPAAAKLCKSRGDNLVAILNLDSIAIKSQVNIDAGRKTNLSLYTAPEGKFLAELMSEVNRTYGINLEQQIHCRSSPAGDDGSFVKEGFTRTILNIGSHDNDPNYHLESDLPEYVDIENIRLTTQATLAAVVSLDQT